MSHTHVYKDVIKYSSKRYSCTLRAGLKVGEGMLRVQLDYFVIIDNNHFLVYIQNELECAFKLGTFYHLNHSIDVKLMDMG